MDPTLSSSERALIDTQAKILGEILHKGLTSIVAEVAAARGQPSNNSDLAARVLEWCNEVEGMLATRPSGKKT